MYSTLFVADRSILAYKGPPSQSSGWLLSAPTPRTMRVSGNTASDASPSEFNSQNALCYCTKPFRL